MVDLDAITHSTMLWYLIRGSGVVTVGLLTLSTAMGVMSTARAGNSRWPRFATQLLHRNISLLSVTLLLFHIVTAVIADAIDVRWYEAFVPRPGAYKTYWLWLGTFAADIMLAIVVTSLLRHRLSHRTWRSIHVAAYVSWGCAILHGIGIGTDATTSWGIGVTVASAGVIAAAGVIRLATFAHERRLAA